jgi:hypothetical protein
MAYIKSAKKGPLVAAISALVLGTLVSLGALYGLNKKFETDEPTIASAASPTAKTPSPPGRLRGVGHTETETARKPMYSR